MRGQPLFWTCGFLQEGASNPVLPMICALNRGGWWGIVTGISQRIPVSVPNMRSRPIYLSKPSSDWDLLFRVEELEMGGVINLEKRRIQAWRLDPSIEWLDGRRSCQDRQGMASFSHLLILLGLSPWLIIMIWEVYREHFLLLDGNYRICKILDEHMKKQLWNDVIGVMVRLKDFGGDGWLVASLHASSAGTVLCIRNVSNTDSEPT